jgi:hypothetical protein
MSLQGSSEQSSIVERSREVIERVAQHPVAQRLTTRPVRVGAASLLWTAAGMYSAGLPRTLANVTSTLISSGILVGVGEAAVEGARRVDERLGLVDKAVQAGHVVREFASDKIEKIGEKVREFKRKREEAPVQSHNESEKMEIEDEIEDNGAGLPDEVSSPAEKRLRTSGEFDANALNAALEQNSEQFPDVQVGSLEVSAPAVVIEKALPQQDDSLELTSPLNTVETPKNRPE